MIQLDEKKITELGHSAEGLLTNKAFAEAFQNRLEDNLMAWLGTKPEDVEIRESYWRSVQELLGVVSLMEGFKEEKDAVLASE